MAKTQRTLASGSAWWVMLYAACGTLPTSPPTSSPDAMESATDGAAAADAPPGIALAGDGDSALLTDSARLADSAQQGDAAQPSDAAQPTDLGQVPADAGDPQGKGDAGPLADAPLIGDSAGTPDAQGAGAGDAQDASADDGQNASADASGDAIVGEGQACVAGGLPGKCGLASQCQGTAIPGFCPGPAQVQCCVPKGAACDPKAAPLPNGVVSAPAGDPGCPAAMAKVESFCIDRWEAHLQLQTANGTFKEWSPYVSPGTQVVRAVSAPNAVPQGYISGTQAAAACKLAGKRLCTDSEWLRACRGPSSWTYPYGSALAVGKCNDHRSVHPAVELYGTTASWIYSKLDNACLNQLPKSLALTGMYSGCVSAEGVLDLMGNLHEWTADPAGTFRGGFYVDTKLNGPGCLYATTAHTSSHWDYSTGFRCCADAK